MVFRVRKYYELVLMYYCIVKCNGAFQGLSSQAFPQVDKVSI
jgi:hypothetical protein